MSAKANARRRKAHELRDQGLSIRQIAERLDVSVSTAHGYLKVPAPEKRNAGPPEHGNARALTHGSTSEQRLAQLRPAAERMVRERWPWIDDLRLAILSDRLARLQSGRGWLDAQAGVVRNVAGDVFPIVDRIEKWGSRVERLVADLEQERLRLAAGNAGGLEAYVAGLGDGDDMEEGNDGAETT
jgi:hypothetical protein